MKQADSLISMIDTAEKKILSVDTFRIKNILDSAEHKVMLLKKFAPDSLDKENTILLSDYLHIFQALQRFASERQNIFSQISFSRKQLADMKQDLFENKMNKEEFAANFTEEKKAVNELCSYVNLTASKTNRFLSHYDFMQAKVDLFIAAMDTVHENKNKNNDLNQGNIDTD